MREVMTPWAEDEIPQMMAQIERYQQRKRAELAEREACAAAEAKGPCSCCGYLKCSAPVIPAQPGSPPGERLRGFAAELDEAYEQLQRISWSLLVERPSIKIYSQYPTEAVAP